MGGRATMVAGIIGLLAVSGCALEAESTARRSADADVPFALLDADAPAVVPEAGGTPVTLCLAREARIEEVRRRLDPDLELVDVVRALTRDVSEQESAVGLRTALPADTQIASASVRRGTAVVDFEAAPELSGPDRVLAIAQIVCTLSHQIGIGQVGFTADGEPLQVPVADGSLVSDPVNVEDYSPLLSATRP